jgi:hypothetical protein
LADLFRCEIPFTRSTALAVTCSEASHKKDFETPIARAKRRIPANEKAANKYRVVDRPGTRAGIALAARFFDKLLGVDFHCFLPARPKQ